MTVLSVEHLSSNYFSIRNEWVFPLWVKKLNEVKTVASVIPAIFMFVKIFGNLELYIYKITQILQALDRFTALKDK